MKSRYQLYLSADKSRRLETLCLRKGSCKSAILEAALDAYLDRQGANELDDRLGVRLQRLERNQEVVAESLALFVRHYLTVTAPMPDVDEASLAIGRERFDGFKEQVLRQLTGGGHPTFDLLGLRAPGERA